MRSSPRAAIGALLALSLLPACESPPGCAYRGACGEPSDSKVCLSFCEPSATAEMVEAGGVRCALDPCAAGVFDDPDVYACPPDHRCVASADGSGRCAPLPGVGGRCGELLEPSGAFEPCADGLACIDSGCPYAEAASAFLGLPDLAPDGTHAGAARCLPPAREGDVCDSNLLDPEPGCRPCEIGFRCLDAEPFGLATEEGQRRCLRSCETREGDVDPGLCRCGDEVRCEEHPDPEGAESSHYCRPCAGNNQQACAGENEVLECCEPGTGSECQPVALRAGAEANAWRCCLGEGVDTCALDRGPNAGCCPGTRCTAEGCQPCGRVGEVPTDAAGCCDGHGVRTDGSGVATCQPCMAMDGVTDYCTGPFLEAIGADGERLDRVLVPSRDVPFQGVRAMSGGELSTVGQVGQVRYRLDPRHRAYLFREPLTEDSGDAARVGRGTEVLRLPTRSGTEQSFVLDDQDWASARVVDIGECSAFLGYERLNDMLALTILQDRSLARDITGVKDLYFKRVWTEPFFGQTAREPIDAPLGVQDAADHLKITIKLRADIKSCARETDIEYVARARMVSEPVREATGATADSDVLMTDPVTAVRCHPTDSGFGCRLVDSVDGEGRPTRTRFIELSNADDFSSEELGGLRSASCTLDGERYVCMEPNVAGDRLVDAVLREVRYRRPLTIDFTRERVRVVLLSEDLSLPNTCYLSAIIAPIIRKKIREALVGEDESLSERVERFFEDAAETLRVRPRRVELLPEGLVLVVAERNDPQVPAVLALIDDLPSGSDHLSCDEERAPEPADSPDVLEVVRAQTIGPDGPDHRPAINTRRICREDEEDCGAICSEFGVPCDQTSVPFAIFGTEGPSSGERCFRTQCCREEDTCDGICDVLFDRDPHHCGACGNECADEEACLDGVCSPCPPTAEGEPRTHCLWDVNGPGRAMSFCLDLGFDPYNCGECFVSCAAGQRCEEGVCVP